MNLVHLPGKTANKFDAKMIVKIAFLLLLPVSHSLEVAPAISFPPQDAARVEGQTVLFNCKVDGDPPPNVTWTKNKEEVRVGANPRITYSSTSDNHTLKITDIQRLDARQYRCFVYNSDGNLTSSPATLNVHFAPAFLDPWQPNINIRRRTTEGNAYLAFGCKVKGNPSPLLYWTKNGKKLNVTANPRLSTVSWNGIHTLNVVNLSRSDAGFYRCVAVNDVGKAASHGESLRVNFAPEIPHPPQDGTRFEGQGVIFSCTVDGDPPPSVTWTRNKEKLKVGVNSRVFVSSTGSNHSLEIRDVQRSDAGQYRCVASNRVSNSSSFPASLIVQFPPEFTSNPWNATRVEGQNITLRCIVYGNPTPDVKWTKDGRELLENQRIGVSNFIANISSLTIASIVLGDEGQYRCAANNSVSDATSDLGKLVVKYKPIVDIPAYGKRLVKMNSRIQLVCQYNASPPVSEVQWEKDGIMIARNATVIGDARTNVSKFTVRESLLSILSISAQDGGKYTCFAANVLGNSSATTTVKIQVKPNPPNTLKLDSRGSRTLQISWTAGFVGNDAIKYYTVETREDNKNSAMQFVKELSLALPAWFPLKVLLLQTFLHGHHITSEFLLRMQ